MLQGHMVRDATSRQAVAHRLKILRLGYGLTQQSMGRELGYKSPRGQAWQHFESGTKMLTRDGYDRLQRRFHTPYRWVYYGEIGECSPALQERIRMGERQLLEHPSGRISPGRRA